MHIQGYKNLDTLLFLIPNKQGRKKPPQFFLGGLND